MRSLPDIEQMNAREVKMGRRKKPSEADERDPAVVKTQQQMNGDDGVATTDGPAAAREEREAAGDDFGIASTEEFPHADADEPANRKAIGYEHPPKEVYDLIDQAMTKWHVELVSAQVKVAPLFARAYDRHGDAIPAIKVRGHAAIAKIKITSLEDRVRGLGDAKLVIDGARWERMGHNARLAMLDHELEHLELDEDKLDDAGRPKLKMKHHDWEMAGFEEVARRQGENAIELAQIHQFHERYGTQLQLFPAGNARSSAAESPV